MNDEPRPGTHEFATKPVTWTEVHKVKDKDTSIVVVISRSSHYPFPRYTIRVGTEWPVREGQPTGLGIKLFFNPRVNDQAKGQANMGEEFDRLEVLLLQAKEWIQTDGAYIANQILNTRIARDEAKANFGKAQTRVTGKTEKNRAKGKARPRA